MLTSDDMPESFIISRQESETSFADYSSEDLIHEHILLEE